MGSFRKRTTLEKNHPNRKTEKNWIKTENRVQNGQIRYISHPSYQNPNQCDTVVTREHTEVIRDQWRRIIAARDQIEERQEKPEPKGEKT